jgi:hypothetical protein
MASNLARLTRLPSRTLVSGRCRVQPRNEVTFEIMKKLEIDR